MTQATEQQHYRAVLCLHCKRPIPIPSLVASMEADLQHNETTMLRDQKCRVFNLRCANCGKEKPYRVGEIVEVDETPGSGAKNSSSTSRLSWTDDRSKAASA